MMNLTIIDENHLNNYERLQKATWFEQNRFRLYWSAIGIIFVLLSFLPREEPDVANQTVLYVQRYNAFLLLLFFVILIARAFYKRHVMLKKIPLMREFETQVRKSVKKYDFDDKGVHIVYGDSSQEYRWSMIQTIHFFKGYILMSSEIYPMASLWIRLTKENQTELSHLVATLQSTYKMKVVK